MRTVYYASRPAPPDFDYEADYWGVVEDPDGVTRDRAAERERYLSDAAAEVAFLNALPGGSILDVGCGRGWLLSALGPQWERHGVEVSRYAARFAAVHADVFLGEIDQADFREGQFDAVVCYHVIEHVPDPPALLREIRRVLRVGGALLVATPDFDSTMARRFGARYRMLHDPGHISLFSLESMRRFLADHGFIVDRVEFPFFETRHFTRETFDRLWDVSKVSPPFPGNLMSFYARKDAE